MRAHMRDKFLRDAKVSHFGLFKGEQFTAAVQPFSARVLLSSGDVFQSQTPDM